LVGGSVLEPILEGLHGAAGLRDELDIWYEEPFGTTR
jgi:hypothetical protein